MQPKHVEFQGHILQVSILEACVLYKCILFKIKSSIFSHDFLLNYLKAPPKKSPPSKKYYWVIPHLHKFYYMPSCRFFFLKKWFYLFIWQREREHKQAKLQAEGEGEAGSLLSRGPNAGMDPRTLGSWPEQKADINPLSHQAPQILHISCACSPLNVFDLFISI